MVQPTHEHLRSGWWGIRTIGSPTFVTAILVVVAALSVGALLVYSFSLSLVDFGAYYQGGADWLRGADPYHVFLEQHLDVPAGFRGGFIYPPYTLPFFGALAWLGYTWEARLWVTGEALALGCLVFMLARGINPRRLAVCTIFVLFFSPTATSFAFGQIGIFVLAGAWGAFELNRRGHEGIAGVTLGAASLFKVFPLVAAVTFLVRGRLRAAFAAGATIAGLAAATWPWTHEFWPEYVNGVLLSKSLPSTNPGNQSIAAAVARLVALPQLAGALEVLLPVVLLAAVVAVVWVARGRDDRLSYALILASIPLIVPNGLQHYYVFALPLLWLLVSAGFELRNGWIIGAAIFGEVAFSFIPATMTTWVSWAGLVAPGLLGFFVNSSVIGGMVVLGAGAYLSISAARFDSVR